MGKSAYFSLLRTSSIWFAYPLTDRKTGFSGFNLLKTLTPDARIVWILSNLQRLNIPCPDKKAFSKFVGSPAFGKSFGNTFDKVK